MGDLWLGFLKSYLTTGVLILLSLPLCGAVLRERIDAKAALRAAQAIFAAALALPWVVLLLPNRSLGIHPAVQVFSGSSGGWSAPAGILLVLPRGRAIARAGNILLGIGAFRTAAVAVIAISLVAASIYLKRVVTLAMRLRRLPVIRVVRGVHVLAGDGDVIPYSAWVPGLVAVVLPLHLFREAADLRVAAAHELQHHRQGDTVWVHFVALARAVFFWNPAAYAWSRLFDRLQEVACDAALIGRSRVSPQAYGRCLLRVAETTTASWSRSVPAGTAGMSAGTSRSFLRRRIEMIMTVKKVSGQASRGATAFAACVILVLAAGAAVSRAEIQDRRLSISIAEGLAEKAAQDAGLPIEANELVLDRLNQFLGSPEKRQKLKDELVAMGPYKEMIESRLASEGMPAAFLAVPLFESGFQKDAVSSHWAAGIWQFIPPTARRYGLAVSGPIQGTMRWTVDDRLDASKETDAAISYLKDLHLIFQDWRLALRAYNEGESHVVQMISAHHTRDPWALERSGSVEGYLAGAVAMMIILRNPTLLD